ncbi:uncharacterized protein LOC123908244 [Trifolium pratense]|uniref:uncharacterized protein LOC123908244 n=1 Tax=Trifolium pratense TaxID=57577 RepID=UPI001E69343E|nr:uncharacterized protein LOC123908244 [Trifolium pratense]
MLPKMFSADFRHKIYRFATLVDPFANQFEVLVEKINNNIYLTHGWYALKDFYNINCIEAWVTLVYTGRGQFGIILRDRFRAVIDPPKFEPPMKFKLYKSRVGSDFVADLLEDTNLLSYTHEIGVDDITFEKKLSAYDITTKFLMVPYEEFGEKAFKKKMTTIEIVDDSGNIWKCIIICGSFQYKHYKIGGEWKRLVAARRIDVGDMIKLHCDVLGKDDHLYIKLNR